MNTEKTAAEWFDMLIEPYCSQAKEASVDLDKKTRWLYDALIDTIPWIQTPQGYVYWSDIYDSIHKGETTYLKPTEPSQPQFGEWVKVEDRLPKDYERVIYFSKKFSEGKRLIGIGFFTPSKYKWDADITHWMPQPPNPTN